MNTSQIIKALMKKHNISQFELSELTGIHKNTISNYVRDVREPSLFNAILIADVFGVSLDELCGRENQKQFEISTYPNQKILAAIKKIDEALETIKSQI